MSRTVSHMAAAAHALSVNAPAKINLLLEVLGRRDDGYHEIHSLAIGVDLADRVAVSRADKKGIVLSCDRPELESPENLACRAVELLAHRLRRDPALRIRLEKRIPVAAGLGGGSSDAAAALRLCNLLWSGGLADEDLAGIGAEIGSDVPLFFSLPSLVVSGRGEIVRPTAMRWSGLALLIFVDVAVPTAPVYAAWREGDSATSRNAAERIAAMARATSADELGPWLSNDLEPAVRRVAPRVGEVFDEIHRAGLGPVRISGAGAAMFRLLDHPKEADEIANRINSMFDDVKSTLVAAPVGPGRVFFEEPC